jgi:hypothetical protein
MNVPLVALYRSADALRPSGPAPPVIKTTPSDSSTAAAPALISERSPVGAHVPLGTTTVDAFRNREDAPMARSSATFDAKARLISSTFQADTRIHTRGLSEQKKRSCSGSQSKTCGRDVICAFRCRQAGQDWCPNEVTKLLAKLQCFCDFSGFQRSFGSRLPRKFSNRKTLTCSWQKGDHIA